MRSLNRIGRNGFEIVDCPGKKMEEEVVKKPTTVLQSSVLYFLFLHNINSILVGKYPTLQTALPYIYQCQIRQGLSWIAGLEIVESVQHNDDILMMDFY